MSSRPERVLAGILLSLFAAATTIRPALSAELSLSSASAKQGEPVEITYISDMEESQPTLSFHGETYKLFSVPGSGASSADGKFRYTAIVSPSLEWDPGIFTMKAGDASATLKILDGKFPVNHLTLPKSKNNFVMSPGEEEAVAAAKATATPERLWTANFNRPSKARVSAGFGIRRIVNGKLLKDYFHSGVDFAGFTGSPVVACAPGKVILAKTGYKLHGNCISIDHGQGVVSFYIHLNKLGVKLGQTVKAGELIGQIGQTGRANGPHLHFSIYVNKQASNPNFWFNSAIK